MLNSTRFRFPLAVFGAALALGGCNIVLGLDDYSKGAENSGGQAGKAGSGGDGGTGGESSGGMGGSGGTNNCSPGTSRACYTGPSGTQDVGICKGGMQTCLADGMGYGPCTGEVLPGTEDCSVAGDEDCNGSSCSETNWARLFGDAVEQKSVVVVPDGQGGVYYAGSMDGTVKFDNETLITGGGRDIFLAHLDADGKVVWANRFGDAQDQDPAAMTVDAAGNIYLGAIVSGTINFGGGTLPAAGYTDIALASFDAQGNHRWSKRFGDNAAQEVHGMAISPAGELVIAGSFGGTMNTGTTTLMTKGSWDVLAAKFNAQTGDEIWSKQFGSTGMEQCDGVAVDASGGLWLIGRYEGFVNLGGNVLPTAAMNDINVFVLKLDGNGKHVFSNGFGDAELFQYARGLAVDSDGSIIFGGDFEGTMNFGGAALTSPAGSRDIYVTKLSSTGVHVWSKKFGGTADDYWPRIALDPAGNVFLACYFTNSIDFGGNTLLSDGSFDFAVARLTADGAHVWSRRFGNPSGELTQQTSADIVWTPRSLFIAASQMGKTDYGLGTLTSAGGFDAAILAIGP